MPARIYIGTAGWSIPRSDQWRFPAADSNLARYARVFPAVEINSTFYRPHRAATFERWAASVPRNFRFSIKLPREMTHDRKLTGSAKLLDEFLVSIAPLGSRAGCLLVQLPPSLVFDARVARGFLVNLRKRWDRAIAFEPRHASWFEPRAEQLLSDFEIARVAADPSRAEADREPGGWRGLAYFRLHGSPRIYYSPYSKDALKRLATTLRMLRKRRVPTWCIFDNTASGAATGDALSLAQRVKSP